MAGHLVVDLFLISLLLTVINGTSLYKQTSFGYGKAVLMDLCQYIGVEYIRNPDNPECGYIACWDRQPYHMPCAPGLKVHPLFFWGSTYPCKEPDENGRCNYVKNFMMTGQNSMESNTEHKQQESDTQDDFILEKDGERTIESVHGTGGEYYGSQFTHKERPIHDRFSKSRFTAPKNRYIPENKSDKYRSYSDNQPGSKEGMPGNKYESYQFKTEETRPVQPWSFSNQLPSNFRHSSNTPREKPGYSPNAPGLKRQLQDYNQPSHVQQNRIQNYIEPPDYDSWKQRSYHKQLPTGRQPPLQKHDKEPTPTMEPNKLEFAENQTMQDGDEDLGVSQEEEQTITDYKITESYNSVEALGEEESNETEKDEDVEVTTSNIQTTPQLLDTTAAETTEITTETITVVNSDEE